MLTHLIKEIFFIFIHIQLSMLSSRLDRNNMKIFENVCQSLLSIKFFIVYYIFLGRVVRLSCVYCTVSEKKNSCKLLNMLNAFMVNAYLARNLLTDKIYFAARSESNRELCNNRRELIPDFLSITDKSASLQHFYNDNLQFRTNRSFLSISQAPVDNNMMTTTASMINEKKWIKDHQLSR